MSDRSNPGPPLIAQEEFCACQPPTIREYLRAAAASALIVLAGAGVWIGLVLLLHRISGVTGLLIAVCAGWLIHRAAGRHRSLSLGILAATSSVLACLVGFALLWLPIFSRLILPRQLAWYHLIMFAMGALVAYGMAGPRDRHFRSL